MGGILLEQWHWWTITLLALTFAGYSSSLKWSWAAVASMLVGGILWFNPDFPLIFQAGIFVTLTALGAAVSSLLIGSKKSEEGANGETEVGEPKPVLRIERLIGYVITLEAPIVNGVGEFELQGVRLRLRGEDCKAGEKVTVVGVDGIERDRLMVEPLGGLRDGE